MSSIYPIVYDSKVVFEAGDSRRAAVEGRIFSSQAIPHAVRAPEIGVLLVWLTQIITFLQLAYTDFEKSLCVRLNKIWEESFLEALYRPTFKHASTKMYSMISILGVIFSSALGFFLAWHLD